MNCIRQSASRITTTSLGRRFLSSIPKQPAIPEMYQNYSFRKTWLNDPSTYPMVIIISFVGSLVVGKIVHEISCDKDLKVSSGVKQTIVRDYGHERRLPFVSNVVDPGFLQPEGLGVDHDDWIKAKASRA